MNSVWPSIPKEDVLNINLQILILNFAQTGLKWLNKSIHKADRYAYNNLFINIVLCLIKIKLLFWCQLCHFFFFYLLLLESSWDDT